MKPSRRRFPVVTIALAVFITAYNVTANPTPGDEFFESKIRPVLVTECYECHGQDKQKGGLTLNSKEGWSKGGESGPAVVPGDPESSLLIRSIRHVDPDLKMPSKAPKLEDAVIEDFVKWVKMGAPDPRSVPDIGESAPAGNWAATLATRRKRWCFQAIQNPPTPVPKNAGWSSHPIDRFLLHRMETLGLAPSTDAESHTVFRRLSFALTGLPPSVEEVEKFVTSSMVDRKRAVEEAVDRLLASQAFGERWARHWMDMARYAETYGSEHDYLNPHAWRYRDYLIRAFNADLPYDRFVQEQVAGDLLDPRWNAELGINESLLGTAWQRMIESYATPVDVKREEATIIDWQIEAVGKTFLGLTIQCARCHDHKFDPISDEDFYALYGVFASTRPTLNILDEPGKLTRHDAKLVQVKDDLRRLLAAFWEQGINAAAVERTLTRDGKDGLQPLREAFRAPNFADAWKKLSDRAKTAATPKQLFADLTREDLAGWKVVGPGLPEQPNPAGLLSLRPGEAPVRAIQPAGYYSDAVCERHAGSIRSPEFVIEKRAVSVLASGSGKARLRLVIENFQNDLLLFAGVNPDLDSAKPKWYTMRVKDQWVGRRARIELMTRDDKTCVGHHLDQETWSKTDGRSAFGIQKVVLHDDGTPPTSSPLPKALWTAHPKAGSELAAHLADLAKVALVRWGKGEASDEDAQFLQVLLEAGLLSNKVGTDARIDALVAEFWETEGKIAVPTRAPGVADDGYSYDSPLFPRGDHTRPGQTVPRRFLEVLGAAPLGGVQSGRLELARELTRRDNPLTARVMANRIWHHLMGRGIVPTVDNFGKMGEDPTHPELLDHLATKLMEQDWSVKRLIRYIVTSRAWQLSPQPGPEVTMIDPNNVYLSHGRVRRLEAESMRDAMLAVAGNLSSGHAGPGIRPYYRTEIDPDKQPKPGPIDGNGKRSIYLEVRRLFPIEFLAAFDAPKTTIFTGQRSQTNVPAQSLALLNDPFVLHQAGIWAKRIQRTESSEEQRIRRMYLEAFARLPTADEAARAAVFVNEQTADPWRALAHAIFNMKEFIYVP